MDLAYNNSGNFSFFIDAQEEFSKLICLLQTSNYAHKEHGEVESSIATHGHEVLRKVFQGYLDQKTKNEAVQSIKMKADNKKLTHIRGHTKHQLMTNFGRVNVVRKGYKKRETSSVYPMDEELNLSSDDYSDGIRQRFAKEVIRGSYDNAIESIDETTGGHIPKRQGQEIVKDIAQDFVPFYEQKSHKKKEDTQDLLILSFDGKGIVMLPNSLRDCTKKAALKNNKLKSRLSQGEKKDRKRMAQVAAVYTVRPYERSAESIMQTEEPANNVHTLRPPSRNKRVWASVEREAETVIKEAFKEALQRDPTLARHWVVLIDGLPQQIRLIKRVMKQLKVKATLVMDFIHVLEYLWKAAWCFFDKGNNAVEKWIEKRAIKILNGRANQVAKGLRISATKLALSNRENIDKCADYLLKNKSRLEYGHALKAGFPIASGIIEGACRHLINDRLDITGARWSLQGAESVLKLRSLKSSNDFDAYWKFHKKQSKKRIYGHFKMDKVS